MKKELPQRDIGTALCDFCKKEFYYIDEKCKKSVTCPHCLNKSEVI